MAVYKFIYYLTPASILDVYFLRDYLPPSPLQSHVLFHANTDAKLEIGLLNTRFNNDTLDIWGLIVWEAVLCTAGCLAASLARCINTDPLRGGN